MIVYIFNLKPCNLKQYSWKIYLFEKKKIYLKLKLHLFILFYFFNLTCCAFLFKLNTVIVIELFLFNNVF